MAKPIDGPSLAMIGIGSILMFAGIKGYSVLAAVGNLVTGKPIATGLSSTTPLVAPQAPAADPFPADRKATPGGGVPNITTNQALGQKLAAAYGWNTGDNWTALYELWNQESSWDNTEWGEPTSQGRAYGIPQALPYTKLPKAGQPESAGGQSDATAQINWGLNYIKGRYGNPVVAEAHENANKWY